MVELILLIAGAVLGTLASAHFHKRATQKVLSIHEMITASPLSTVNEPIKSQLAISFKGQPLSEAAYLELYLFNAGDLPIEKPEDKTVPVRIFTTNGAKLVACAVSVESERSAAAVKVSEEVHVSFAFINPGHGFSIQLLFEGEVSSDELVVQTAIPGLVIPGIERLSLWELQRRVEEAYPAVSFTQQFKAELKNPRAWLFFAGVASITWLAATPLGVIVWRAAVEAGNSAASLIELAFPLTAERYETPSGPAPKNWSHLIVLFLTAPVPIILMSFLILGPPWQFPRRFRRPRVQRRFRW